MEIKALLQFLIMLMRTFLKVLYLGFIKFMPVMYVVNIWHDHYIFLCPFLLCHCLAKSSFDACQENQYLGMLLEKNGFPVSGIYS